MHPSARTRAAAALSGAVMALLLVTPALAQAAGTEHVVGGVAGFGLWDWVSLALRIGAVLVVIWGAVLGMRWYVRRMSGGVAGHAARQLQIIETRALGPNRALHLVRVGNRAVLIGATPERINALLEIGDAEQLERLLEDGGEPAGRRVSGLLSGFAAMPGLAARARSGVTARLEAAREARVAAPRRRRSRPAGFLTVRLARLGRWLRQPAGSAARPVASAARAPLQAPRQASARTGIFSAPRVPRAPRPQAPPPPGSLFERTLADAEAAQRGGAAEPGLARGLRARSGYQQAAASSEDVAWESRITELQRAITSARRSAG